MHHGHMYLENIGCHTFSHRHYLSYGHWKVYHGSRTWACWDPLKMGCNLMVADDFPTILIHKFGVPPLSDTPKSQWFFVYHPLNPMKISLLLMVISGDIPIVSTLNPNKSLLLMVIKYILYIYTHTIYPIKWPNIGSWSTGSLGHATLWWSFRAGLFHVALAPWVDEICGAGPSRCTELPTLVDLQIPGNLETNETHVYQVSWFVSLQSPLTSLSSYASFKSEGA